VSLANATIDTLLVCIVYTETFCFYERSQVFTQVHDAAAVALSLRVYIKNEQSSVNCKCEARNVMDCLGSAANSLC